MTSDAWTGSVLYGARYLYLGEEFVVTGDPIQGDETILRTNNHMFGPQLGTEFIWSAEASLRARFGGKGAALLNVASEKTGNTLEPLFAGQGTEVQFGTLLELYAGLEKTWGFGTLKVGYQIFYVSGVALAPDQLANFAPYQVAGLQASHDVHDQGAIFAHGVSAGFEHRW